MAQNKLYIGNLPYSVDEAKLRSVFSGYGDISEIAVIKDRDTGRPKGFAFITFGSQQAAEKALEQNGHDLDGRPLKVNMAVERDARHGRAGNSRSGPSRW